MTAIELTIEDAEFIAFELAQALMASKEPFPEFVTRNPHRLEGVLAAPFTSWGGKEKYPTIAEKAAVLFYHGCKDHPLQNGNKRMAVVLVLVFLAVNDWWITIDPKKLYRKAKRVAKSNPAQRDKVVAKLVKLINKYLVRLADTPGGAEFIATRDAPDEIPIDKAA